MSKMTVSKIPHHTYELQKHFSLLFISDFWVYIREWLEYSFLILLVINLRSCYLHCYIRNYNGSFKVRSWYLHYSIRYYIGSLKFEFNDLLQTWNNQFYNDLLYLSMTRQVFQVIFKKIFSGKDHGFLPITGWLNRQGSMMFKLEVCKMHLDSHLCHSQWDLSIFFGTLDIIFVPKSLSLMIYYKMIIPSFLVISFNFP